MPEVYKLTEDDKEFLSKLPITNEQLIELFKFMNEHEGEHVDEKEKTEKLN